MTPTAPSLASGTETRFGRVVRVAFDRPGFRILKVEVAKTAEPETWIGPLPAVAQGQRLRATGAYETDPNHGRQFRVKTAEVLPPTTAEGIEAFLRSTLPGIGPATAKAIVAKFGEGTLDVLDQHPEQLLRVGGITPAKLDKIREAWTAHAASGRVLAALAKHDLSPSLAAKVLEKWGAREALRVVESTPYELVKVDGVGFLTADRIALATGLRADAPERAEAAVLHALGEASGAGHCYARREVLVEAVAALLDRPAAVVEDAIDRMAEGGRLVREHLPDGEAVFTPALRRAEERVARRLRELLAAPARLEVDVDLDQALAEYEERAKVTLADAQREAVRASARSKVLVITGGPGVGKSTVLRAILAVFGRAKYMTLLAAPTGRAAKRMAEATGHVASTLHSLLGFKDGKYERTRDFPLDAHAITVDETSMVDVWLMDALLQAVPDGARLLLVGDVDQLPSVGPGAVLRDVIASGTVPTVRLTQVFRQAAGSRISVNAARINAGEMPEGDEGPGGEFYVVRRDDAPAAAAMVLDFVTQRIPRAFGLDPRTQVQVLTPMHKGETGTIALNAALQQALNPKAPELRRKFSTLREGDRVIHKKNDRERNVMNGDLGYVTKIAPDGKKVTVTFDGREVAYEGSQLDQLELAYAISCHKSQGGEFPCVVIPLLTQHYTLLSRNLVYTAVTRGKKLVVLVTNPRALKLALAETRREQRNTRLAERLREVR